MKVNNNNILHHIATIHNIAAMANISIFAIQVAIVIIRTPLVVQSSIQNYAFLFPRISFEAYRGL